MKKYKNLLIYFIVVTGLLVLFKYSSCVKNKIENNEIKAKIIGQGNINVFPYGLTNEAGDTVNCEASAVVFLKNSNSFIIASDKPIYNKSSVFTIPYSLPLKQSNINYNLSPEFIESKKIEDMSIAPDSKLVFAITAFDRVKKNNAFDTYNNLMYWYEDKPSDINLVQSSSNFGVRSSVQLRKRFSEVLKNKNFPDGMPYYSIEGLMALPDKKLVFGIRAIGKSYINFKYTNILIETNYRFEEDRLVLDEKFKLIYKFTPEDTLSIKRPLGLAGIEYDPYNKQILMLTSYEIQENDEGLGAYIWVLSLDNLKNNKPPELVRKSNGKPLLLAHKAEGITIIDKKTIFVINDDDRVKGRNFITNEETQFKREHNQAPYTIIKF